MNPLMLLKAWYRQYTLPCIIFIVLFSIALSLGIALLSQERAIKQSSANVSDQFDLIIGAPGSKVDLVLNTAFLKTGFLETVPTHIWHELLDDQRVKWFAPIVFGDGYHGAPIIGTTQALLTALYGEQENFPTIDSAFIGANVDLGLGDIFQPQHGMIENAGDSDDEEDEDHHAHHVDYKVAKKLPVTGTPWDNAILVPVEASWQIHGMGNGHAEEEHEAHDHDDVDHNENEEEHHHDEHDPLNLGVFDEHDTFKPVSAFIVKPNSIASAYGLRSDFSNNETQAVFPGEVMVMLYALMGDARTLMSQITLICEGLVMLSLVFAIAALFALFKREFAILRTIGATRNYLLLSVWLFVLSLMTIGLLLGMLLATIEVQWISTLLSDKAQFSINATLQAKDGLFALAVLAVGSIMALLPALFVYRVSNEKLMQSI